MKGNSGGDGLEFAVCAGGGTSDGVVDGGSVSGTTVTLTRTEGLADVTITGLPSAEHAGVSCPATAPTTAGELSTNPAGGLCVGADEIDVDTTPGSIDTQDLMSISDWGGTPSLYQGVRSSVNSNVVNNHDRFFFNTTYNLWYQNRNGSTLSTTWGAALQHVKDEGLNASIPTAVVDAKFLGHFLTKQEASEALSLRSDRATAVYIYANTSINVVYRILTYTDPVFSTTETFFWVGPLRDAHQIENALTNAGRLLPVPTGTAQTGFLPRVTTAGDAYELGDVTDIVEANPGGTGLTALSTVGILGTDYSLGGGTDDQTAAEVTVDATAFAGNLSATDTDVQTLAATVDGLTLGGVLRHGRAAHRVGRFR